MESNGKDQKRTGVEKEEEEESWRVTIEWSLRQIHFRFRGRSTLNMAHSSVTGAQ